MMENAIDRIECLLLFLDKIDRIPENPVPPIYFE